ncbi:hypothetical protein C1H46_045791 [Malus baccata]|uniref:Uncharacterized protein n=1 Tax=Malus baccata TaxID=106549 RepID=A0A540K332_MALBA|nr:hypothetical protein C1H46_045791 [Malus baccata]
MKIFRVFVGDVAIDLTQKSHGVKRGLTATLDADILARGLGLSSSVNVISEKPRVHRAWLKLEIAAIRD